MMQFELPKEMPSIIKVIGVGGGGSNAVNYMYKLGIKGVEFLICNTDHQALEISPVPTKVQLGPSLTEGRGAGAIPEVGKNAAIENIDEIRAILKENTKMVFITAGMGGGTGTGAAPIIAGLAKEMGILTVAIVTVPFSFEGKKRKAQADKGLDELKRNVDTLLVICNDKLREIHGDLKLSDAFSHADNILAIAAKSIAEIITKTLHINVDFADIQTVMRESGVAIMGSASAEGDQRAMSAVMDALDSPLLNDNNIEGARYILLNITSGDTEVTMDEMGEITDYIQEQAGMSAEVIMGVGHDETLGNRIGVTIIATGFKTKENLVNVTPTENAKVVYDINGEVINKQEPKVMAAPAPSHSPVVESIPFVAPSAPKVVEQVAKPTPAPTPSHPVFNFIKPTPQPVVNNMNQVNQPSNSSAQQIPVAVTPVAPAPVVNHVEPPIIHVLKMDEEEVKPEVKQPVEPVNELEPTLFIREPENVVVEEEKTFVFEVSLPPVEEPKEVRTEKVFEPVVNTRPAQEVNREAAPVDADDPFQRAKDRIMKLKEMSMKMSTPSGLVDLEKEPAYKRRNVQLNNIPSAADPQVSRFTLNNDQENKPEIRPNNTFLHDRVD